MNKISLTLISLAVLCAPVFAEPVKDWHDIEKVHKHVQDAIHEMERVREANRYDMAGHAEKAEQLLRDAERELHDSVEAAKHAP